MTLQEWMRTTEQAVAAIGRGSAVGINQPATDDVARAVVLDGFLGILPLWTGTRHVVGLVADPRSDPHEWRGVILQDGQGLTIASDSRTLLPQLIVQRSLSNAPETTAQLADRWSSLKEPLFHLHRVLGGVDESLKAVEDVVLDVSARDAFRFVKGGEAAFESAHSRLCRAIDGSASFVRYADWLDGCIAGNCRVVSETRSYGPWERRVLCWTQRLRLSGLAQELPTARLVSIVEAEAGIDSGVPREPSWSVHAGGASATTALVEAADELRERGDALDPVSAAVVAGLTAEDTSYGGLAHAEAAVALDEQGDAIRSWGALQSAAWWAARSGAKVTGPMLDGARSMASRHKWSDVAWLLEHG